MAKAKPVSLKKLYSMVRPDWIFGVIGTLGAFVAGAQMPLFALGVTQALVSYYMVWETTQREVKKIALLFCGGAVLTVFFHVIEHLNFGIMGERLTLRVRERMFGGKVLEQNQPAIKSVLFRLPSLLDITSAFRSASDLKERDRLVRRHEQHQRDVDVAP